ncbi:MAG TPA: SDR family oxidoreductase [Bacteroidales bacterium]|nr:SDR family oxidoreductase [Bacteroidales bacterium]
MSVSDFSLNNKVLLITGASSGIGRQCAITCSHYGAKIALFGRDENRLQETLHLMKDPEKHRIFSVDLLDYEVVNTTIQNVCTEMGRLTGIINCAGISTTLPINSLSVEKLEKFIQTNVISAINITRQAIKSTYFSESGGSVIFLSSVMGIVGESGKTLYSLTKGALISGVKSMAVELAYRKIRVNCVSPGVVETPMSMKAVYSQDEESLNKIRKLHPLDLGKPDDIANACVFLLSDASKWITGTNLIVDGGYTAR